jgi:prepilin-type N-terminal cleavage/methylation domain-containing protein
MIFLQPYSVATPSAHSGCKGFTLVELLTVVFILSLLGLIVRTSSTSSEPQRLELASGEIAAAFRHARGESMHQVNSFGVHTETTANRTRVFRGTLGANPLTPIYDVYHPISKQLYTLLMDGQATTSGVTLAQTGSWSGTCNKPDFIGFDAAGTPRCIDPLEVVLITSDLTLRLGAHSRTLSIDGETGRVTVL